MGNVSRNFGKFKYIEPNEVLENNLYNKPSGIGSYNITQPYEDYSISVEMEVKVPNRGVWVADLTNTTNVGVSATNGNVISFFGGKNEFLTDTPGSLIYTDLLKNKQDAESLGITNIHISYNSYFYPEVTIKFTDIRGMGLMMPHEENFRQEYLYQGNNNKLNKVDKFFAALFTFPYPEFTLRVKGFYGKKVEYSLVVSEFKSSFNSQTGNFEAVAKFVGKMYGVYTDIPMAYLLIAPYCQYGNKNGETIWNSKKFTFDNGTPIPKFLNLRNDVIKAIKNVQNELTQEKSEIVQYTAHKENSLHSVQLAYNDISKKISINWPYKKSMDKTVISYENIFLFEHEDGDNDGNGYPYLYKNVTDNSFINATNELYDKISSFNQHVTDNTLPYPEPFSTRNAKIGNDTKFLVSVKKDDTENLTFNWNDDSVKIDLTEYNTITDRLRANINKESEKTFFVVNAKNLVEKIKKIQENIKDEKKKQEDTLKAKANRINEKVLGFKPNIKNVFKILMAHLQTFVELFATCTNNINNDSRRTIVNKGLSKATLPDIPSGISEKSHIPPFPAFKRINSKEFCYPTESGMTGTIEEAEFIDALLLGASEFSGEAAKSRRFEENTQIANRFFIPTCITDFNCYKNGTNYEFINPYHYVFDCKEDNIGMDWVWTFFAMRCIQKFIMEQNDELTPEEFGAYEAYNLWLAHPQLDENPETHNQWIKSLTEGEYSNKDSFISFLLRSKNSDSKKCYQVTAGFPSLLAEIIDYDGSKLRLRPYTNANFPARIGHGDNFKNQFVNDSDNLGYSYKGGDLFQEIKEYTCTDRPIAKDYKISYYSLPYKLISEIDSGRLQNWDENLKSYKNIPTDLNKHGDIIKKYYNNKKGFYYNGKTNQGFKEYDTNPAWNIIYQTGITSKFFQIITKTIPDIFASSVCTLEDHLSGEFENSKFLGIHTLDQESLFLNGNLMPEDLLFAIPHNFERIVKDLRDGKKLVNIPYSTKLFLGYIIDYVQNCENKDDIKTFFSKLLERCCGVTANALGIYNNPNYTLEGINDNYFGNRFAKLFFHLLCYLTSSNDGFVTLSGKWDKLDIADTPELVAMDIWAYKKNGFFINDTLSLSNEYRRWCKDTNTGGFEWFKNKLCLKITPKLTLSNINIEIKKPESQIDILRKYLSDESFYKPLQELSDKYKDNPTQAASSKDNLLNYIFRYHNEDLPVNSMSNAFSDVYSGVFCQGREGKIENVYLQFNESYDGVKELDKFLKKVSYIIVPYELTSRNDLKTPKNNIESAFTSFINNVKKLYAKSVEENEAFIDANEISYISNDSKFAMYRTLKNLYDKHFFNIGNELHKYSIKDENSEDAEINRFYYIDTYYDDIGDKFMVNASILLDIINIITDGYESGKGEGKFTSDMSVYSFMSYLCQRHNMMLIAMPIFNGHINETDNFEKMFTPLSYLDTMSDNSISGPSYVCFYPHQPSQYLDIPVSQYENDGFLITDINDTQNFNGPSTITEMRESNYVIPSFGVEYGTQKQSIFQNITVNMDNPQTTEAAVAIQFGIAEQKSTDPNRLVFEGQDLFKIYSNYSYTCQVEMMGCAQIQPLMYFQLNNIPMFRGAYQIIQVEHDITPGNMITSFKGVRINKNIMPMADNYFIVDIKTLLGEGETETNNADYSDYQNDFEFKPLDNKAEVYTSAMENHTKSDISAQRLLNDEETRDYIKFDGEDKKTNFNRLNPTLRQLVYCIAKDMKELSKNVGYTIGLCITSATRDHKESKSDHNRQTDDNNLIFGRNNRGVRLSDNGEITDDNASYEVMGAAVDFVGLKDGQFSKNDASIHIFNHIAMNYNKYIKQLIWEIKPGDPSGNNNITNCVHLSSIGEATPENKASIFMWLQDGENSETIRDTSKKTLAPAFVKICDNLISQSLSHLPKSQFYSYNNA